MMKIDRTPFNEDENVAILASVEPWDGEGTFPWSVMINGRGFYIRERILPLLLQMTKGHCAFCDYYPLSKELLNPIPIEHFYPKCKGKFPEKAYQWENLFPSCHGCTDKKKDRFDEKLLKPDDEEYSFDAFFKITGDGKLEPADTCDPVSRERVKVTIDIYKLNERGTLLSMRKRALTDYQRLFPVMDSDERPFRFLIPIAAKAVNPDQIINSFLS